MRSLAKLTVLLVALAAAEARGATSSAPAMGWHVVLSSGFDLTCARMEAIPEAKKTRLYLHPDTQDFVDVPTAEIVATEQVEIPAEPQPTGRMTPAEAQSQETGPQDSDIASLAAGAAQWVNLDPDLIASVIQAESAGHRKAVSHAGAQGLMQLMPATASQAGVQNSFDPKQNIFGGTAYLGAMLLRYHDDLPKALAAYNAGPGAVDRYGGVPPYRETQAYVARVIRDFNRRKKLSLRAVRNTVQASVRTPQDGIQ